MDKTQILKTIDCTPTWAALFPAMWHLIETGNKQTLFNLKPEFERMAAAADKWNEHCKKEQVN